MKYCLTIFFSILSIGILGQTVDSLGLDDNPRLTKYEAEYFNNEFKNRKGDFDFTDKKVAFITGSSASKYLRKSEYFNEVKERLRNNYEITHTAIFLTWKEKEDSGDYDVIVTVGVKLLTDKRRRQIINELKATRG